MKTKTIAAGILLFAGTAFAQEDMRVVWETKMSHEITYTGTGLEGKLSYAASDKEITVFKNDDAAVVWTAKFKELAPSLRKIDEIIPFWESGTLFLFERKTGKDQVACVDIETGKLLWNSNKYQNLGEENVVYIKEEEGFALSMKDNMVFLKARTGEEIWETSVIEGVVGKYIYNEADKTTTMVNFMPSFLGSLFSGFKNQIVRMDMKTGEILWEETYIGRAERKVISREFLYDLDLVDDKIVLRLNGIQVYDYKTGAPQWQAAFDYTPAGVVRQPAGKVLRFGVYGAVADPVTVGNDVYVLDMTNKKNQYIKKYDKNTGKLIWTSKEIKGAKAIPNMYVMGDKIVLQIGGAVEYQALVEREVQVGDYVYIYRDRVIGYDNVKPNGVQAFNTSDGSLAWDSERFKKGITNMIDNNGSVLVCSGKSYYGIKGSDGSDLFEVKLSEDGIGLASSIMPYKDKVVVVGEKGVSIHNSENGQLEKSAKYKSSYLHDVIDNILVMKTDKADIAAYNLEDCTYREFKAKKDATTTLSQTAEYVYVFEKKRVYKVATL